MTMQLLDVPGWEQVWKVSDDSAGLLAIISIHSTLLGPSFGGCRMYPYASFADGLEDVKNLSKGMTYKNALCLDSMGGGKSVIFGDPRKDKTPALLRAFALAVDKLKGRYYTAQDVGLTSDDLGYMSQYSARVAVQKTANGYADPSDCTALGVFFGMQQLAAQAFDTFNPDEPLRGRHVIVVGLGHVGMQLCEHLHNAGAQMSVADIDRKKCRIGEERFGATIVDIDEAFRIKADILAPCALGGALNDVTIPGLRVKAVAGCANNQLKDPDRHDQAMFSRGILYAPDYVINAGGVIGAASSFSPDLSDNSVRKERVRQIGPRIGSIITRAKAQGCPPAAIADSMVRDVLRRHKKIA